MKEVELGAKTIGEIVAEDFRTASVFREAGIDFCCGGKMTLDEACDSLGIDTSELIDKLENSLVSRGMVNHNFIEWSPAFLCDYIVNEHHSYVRRSLPEIVVYTNKIARVHGDHHPELLEVADLFEQINKELFIHMKKEEELLFPAVKELFNTNSEKSRSAIREVLNQLLGEHEFAGGAMDRINTVTMGYNLPDDACNSYRMAFEMLSKFEDDLHIHVHLENNILFPKTLDKLNRN